MCFGFDADAAVSETFERQGHAPRAPIGRRTLLGAVAGTTALGAMAATGLSGAAAAAPASSRPGRRRVPQGRTSIQLYTLRADLATDYRRSLRYVAAAGYRRVEQAGYYGLTARQLRRFHDGLGIRTSSSHDGLSATRDALEVKLENAGVLGQRYLNVPYLKSDSPDQWRAWAWQMNSEAYAAKKAGLRYGYHNHAHEFLELANGERPWDILATELDPDLVHLEADLYWVVTGGIQSGDGATDPVRFAIDTLRASRLKVRQFHVKDRDPATGDMADLGTGMIDFRRIFSAVEVEEYVVENDTPDVTPQQTAEVGYDYLRRLRY
jgi:sugar phosphate isomerase/epimerase